MSDDLCRAAGMNIVAADGGVPSDMDDTKRMTIAVYGKDQDGNLIEIGKPTYIHVPEGCKVIVRCRAAGWIPQEWDSENWERDPLLQDPSIRGLWGTG